LIKGHIQEQQPIMALAVKFKCMSPSKGQIVDATVSAAQQVVWYVTARADIISVLMDASMDQTSNNNNNYYVRKLYLPFKNKWPMLEYF
jgi:indole-3-glycerol phosphate synthase